METKITMQQLKEQRLTPAEKFVLDKIKGVKPIEPSENGDVGWFNKDNELLFQQDFEFSHLLVSWRCIWLVLEKQYGLKYNEIQQLINNVMYKYTNKGQLTPVGWLFRA